MDFTAVLRGRRMGRNYRPDPVAPDALDRIVTLVHRAPNAGFAQGHRIVVIADPARRADLAAIAEPWLRSPGRRTTSRRPAS